MATITYFDGIRGYPGFLVNGVDSAGVTKRYVLPARAIADSSGNVLGDSANPLNVTGSTQSGVLPAGTNRSGTATTTSGQLAAANANRRGLNIQNIGANNIGINEFGATAAIGTAGTYTVAPGASVKVNTNQQINVIAATGGTAYSATEF